MKSILLRTTLAILIYMTLQEIPAQSVIYLYDKKVPGFTGCAIKEQESKNPTGLTVVANVMQPSLTVFLPKNNTKPLTAVIICPGGGYSRLAIDHEGYEVAKAFTDAGVAAFILKYRLPDLNCFSNSSIAPLQDAQEAMKVVRGRAKEWNLDPNKIGVLGFSAGGHVASSIGTHYTQSYIKNENNISLRPDFLFLLYPVISFTDSLAHIGSRNNLIGKNPGMDSIILFSNELQVNAKTPPSFLVHAADDKGVKCENSIEFFKALKKNNVPAELHIYEKGGHGFGLHNKTTDDQWFDRAINWLKSNQLL